MTLKVFVSHASEDKERFVVGFATKLRQNGIDAWLDRWEMVPGDSLVDKIFEEGIANAVAVIVVLSKYSVAKPWVREELNAAFVKRVNSKSKLIPILLDECTVPEALSSTLWEKIDDLNSYEASFGHIMSSLTGVTDKPPLGSLPTHITSPVRSIPGLAKLDNTVLKAACEAAMKVGHTHINGSQILEDEDLQGISEESVKDSLEILDNSNMLKLMRHIGPGLPHFQISIYGFQTYAKAYIENYDEVIKSVAYAIVNNQLTNNEEIAAHIKANQFLVDHALDVLENQGYVRLAKAIGGHVHVIQATASLRRALA